MADTKAEKWVTKFPPPGPKPEPPGEAPPDGHSKEAFALRGDWTKKVRAFNEWIYANRNHIVASAVDDIIEQQKTMKEWAEKREGEGLRAVPQPNDSKDSLILVLGIAHLERELEKKNPTSLLGILAGF